MKRCVLRACLNAGVDLVEHTCMSKERLFRTVGPMKEKGPSLKVYLLVDGMHRVKPSKDE